MTINLKGLGYITENELKILKDNNIHTEFRQCKFLEKHKAVNNIIECDLRMQDIFSLSLDFRVSVLQGIVYLFSY